MKILFISHYSELYGANRSLLGLLEGFLKYPEIEPLVIIPNDGPIELELQNLGIGYKKIFVPKAILPKPAAFSGFIHRLKFLLRYSSDIVAFRKNTKKATKQIETQINLNSIDVVYSNSAALYIGFILARKHGIPHFWHIREFIDLDYGHTPVYGWRDLRKKLKASTGVVYISKAIQTHFRESSNAAIIYNGVLKECTFHKLKERKTKLDQCHYFLMIGLLAPSKGQQFAIRAMQEVNKKHPHHRLKLVGEGDYSEILKKLAAELGIAKNIEFEGYKSDVYPYLKDALGLLMCSQNEGMGRATVEAMAAKCPVIGYNHAGTAELIIDNKTGYLYREVAELSQAMIHLIENTSSANAVTDQAWDSAKSKYSIEGYADSVLEFIHHKMPLA